MLKESRVHLEPLSEKVQKIRQEAKRAIMVPKNWTAKIAK
jgi:hypothetical protein